MHGWLTGTRPTGDKLKGEESKRVRSVRVGDPTPPVSGLFLEESSGNDRVAAR